MIELFKDAALAVSVLGTNVLLPTMLVAGAALICGGIALDPLLGLAERVAATVVIATLTALLITALPRITY